MQSLFCSPNTDSFSTWRLFCSPHTDFALHTEAAHHISEICLCERNFCAAAARDQHILMMMMMLISMTLMMVMMMIQMQPSCPSIVLQTRSVSLCPAPLSLSAHDTSMLWPSDDDDYYDDDDDIYIMMQCVFVTKNHHFLSAWDERLEAQSKTPAWPYRP